ncbi:hypothetical protein LOD99_15822 [Oopsacas minuta]|uniref:Uncharacterized protein n=1 Tax=Oopsacas minuta TaxID=111878 RepID=A0AAV7KAE4_9METZ|nr:hypothetical protein LOD99_15822 [Oopsacas minuta]
MSLEHLRGLVEKITFHREQLETTDTLYSPPAIMFTKPITRTMDKIVPDQDKEFPGFPSPSLELTDLTEIHTSENLKIEQRRNDVKNSKQITAGYMKPTFAYIMHSKHSKSDYIATIKL